MKPRRQTTKVRMEKLDDLYPHCAGLDVHKAVLTVCLIAGGTEGELAEYETSTGELRRLRDWLIEKGVTHVVMESTGVYWKPVWQILETGRFQLLLANARQVRNIPGRKTDQNDAVWLATLLRKGLIPASLVPPAEVRALRDLCRSRASLIHDRTRIVQRVEKVLEEANLKLDTVVSDLMGISARRMLDELGKGNNDPAALAELAVGRLRSKIPELIPALEGSFLPHQLFVLQELLQHHDELSSRIERFEQEIDRYAPPFEKAVERLIDIPGLDRRSALAVLAETGQDMSVFPSPQQFARWARVCPGNQESAGKRKSGRTGKGNSWLRAVLVQCAWAASHTKNTYLSAQFKRLVHRGSKKAAMGVAHSTLKIIWYLLHNQTRFKDLGADYFAKQNLEGQTRSYVNRLKKLGYEVTLTSMAAGAVA